MTSEEKMREEFEAWWSAEIKNMTPGAQMMANFAKGMYWHGWKASRESLVIELPKKYDQFADDDLGRRAATYSFNHCIDVIEKSIHAEGVKTK